MVRALLEDEELERRRDERKFQDACSSDDETAPGAPTLPWGVKKRLIREAPSTSDDLRPVLGDEVSVHFTAKLMNGTQIGSSRDSKDGLPFKFVVGKEPREIVLGLEMGVATMRKGEVARFKVAPRFAYDDLGAPPLVPPDAALTFEVELLDWETKEDLFCDLRAIKTVLQRGSGQEKPRRGQDVLLSLKVSCRRNRPLEEHATFEHTVCAQDFGPLDRIVAQAVQTMVEGERCSVKLSWDACTDRKYSEASLELALERVFELEDASPAQDGSLMRKVLRRGAGDGLPRDGCAVSLHLSKVAGEDGAAPPIFFAQRLDFRLGDGEVCDALEFAALRMKVGEEVVLTCTPPAGVCEPRLGLTGKETSASLTLELLSFSQGADPAALALPERLAFAAERKDVGAKLFGRQRFALALERYKGVLALIETSSGEEGDDLRLACELNRAACLLKLGDPQEARAACGEVLRLDPHNLKALFRRASANFALSNYEVAMSDITLLLSKDPRNADARGLAAKVKEAQRQYSQHAKSTAAKMVLRGADAAAAASDAPQAQAQAAAAAGKAAPSLLARLPVCLAEPCARLCGHR